MAPTRRPQTTVAGTAFDTNTIVCPSATVCLAGGNSASGAVIVTINGSNGAASIADTDTTQESGFYGIACPTATGCVAVDGSGEAASVNASNGALGRDHTATPPEIYNAIACPGAAHCYAGGLDLSSGHFVTTLTRLSPTGVPGTPVDGQNGQITGLACVSATRCYATIANGAGGDIVVINNGKVTKTFPTTFDGEAIACSGAASCIAVGNMGSMIYAATINPTTGNPGTPKLIKNMSQVMGVTCATSTECLAVGFLLNGSKLTARVSDIANGKPAAATTLPGQSLSGVACSTPTTCWAIGEDKTGTGIVDAVPVP